MTQQVVLRRRYRLGVIFIFVLVASAPEGASAQTLRGILSERDTYAPIDLGLVTLVTESLDTLGQTLSDDSGYFEFVTPGAGQYYLIASALGYRAVRSELVRVDESSVQIVELSMAARPVPVEGLLIEANMEEPEVPGLVGTGFYERLARGRGEFIMPGQIAASEAQYVQALFWGMKTIRVHQTRARTPGPWNDDLVMPNRFGAGYCAPSVYIDGVWVREFMPGESVADAVLKDDLEAVEVYEWPFGVPSQYKGAESCGVILFWTRR